jgi:hypothetical protein
MAKSAAKTAAKAAAPKKPGTAVAEVKKTAVVSVEAMKAAIKKDIAEVAETTGSPSGDELRIGQNKMFKLPDGTEHPGPITLVVVDYVTGRYYYDRPFNKANPCPPACVAISRTPTDMAPFKNVPDKQSDDCAGCPMNQWESAETGKGKACKEHRVLAVIPEDADATTQPSIMKVSPTALKAFDSYARSVASALQVPLWAVKTTISFDPNQEYPTLRFGSPEVADEDLQAIAFSLKDAARQRLLATPDFTGYTPKTAKKKR